MKTKKYITSEELMKKLYRRLRLEFPPHHWNHLNVWTAYWDLAEKLKN